MGGGGGGWRVDVKRRDGWRNGELREGWERKSHVCTTPLSL